jgi:hypothetical protein
MERGSTCTRRRSLTFLKVDFEVIGAMFRECFRFALAEDVRELVVFLQNTGEVNQVSSQGCMDFPESVSFTRLSWKL